MPTVMIDGIEYVPKGEIPPLTEPGLALALQSLTEILYFSECSHKHGAWAWNALNALAPHLAGLSPKAAFDLTHLPLTPQSE